MRREMVLADYHARFYSPTIGKFTQPDTIIPSLTNSQSWNRYAYVNNSPVMYSDPSGHLAEGENNGDICLPGSDCDPGYTVIGVKDTDLASSVERNKPASQYYPISPITGEPIPEECGWSCNLCGFIVLSIILEHENPTMALTLYNIWMKGGNGTESGIGVEEFIIAMSQTFPGDQAWNAIGYSGMKLDLLRNSSIQKSQGLGSLWYEDSHGENTVKSMMFEAYDQNHYLVPLVTINGSGELQETGEPNHWVLVTDMTEETVTIINPFQNRFETHTWDVFLNSMEDDANHGNHWLLDIWRSE